MNKYFSSFVIGVAGVVCCMAVAVAAGGKDAYYIQPEVYAMRPDPAQEKALDGIGATGIKARFYPGVVLKVEGFNANSPAEGKMKAGEIIVGVNGVELKGIDPLVALGHALTAAEATDGRMVFDVKACENAAARKVTVMIPVLGTYSDTWPLNCEKSKKIIKAAGEYYGARIAAGSDNSLTDALACLFLLSTGDDTYLPVVKAYFLEFPKDVKRLGDHTWHNGYNGIACAEYYLRTGDQEVLPILQYYCDNAKERQLFGCGWNHWGRDINPVYVAGGLMNPAGTQVLTTLLLGKACGVRVDEQTLLGALKYTYRFAGHGTVPYGDHRPEGGLASNGKDGMAAAAMRVAMNAEGDTDRYEQARNYLSMSTLMSYSGMITGHADEGRGDGIWRGTASAYMLDCKPADYHAAMKQLQWFYDLSRRPSGALGMAGCQGYDDIGSGAGVALAYTAPLKTLAITGASRSKYAKKFTLPEALWGNEADLAFLSIKNAKKFSDYGKEEPIEVLDRKFGNGYSDRSAADLAGIPKQEILKSVYHTCYMIRVQAAKALRITGAFDELEKLLGDSDPRVRRAALDGICDYNYWFHIGNNPMKPEQFTPGMVEGVVKMLKNKTEALWVTDGALTVMSLLPPETAGKNLELIMPWASHDDWWLRQSAFGALATAAHDTNRVAQVLPTLLDMMLREDHTQPREGMVYKLNELLKSQSPSSPAAQQILAAYLKAAEERKIIPGTRAGEGEYDVEQSIDVLIRENPGQVLDLAKAMQKRLGELSTKCLVKLANDLLGAAAKVPAGQRAEREKLDEAKRKELTDILFNVYRTELVKRLKAEDGSNMQLINTIVDLTKLKEKVALPCPDPATFISPPSTRNIPEIVMTATTGRNDFEPNEYFFDETSGNPGGTDSAWTTNTVYTDTGLEPGTSYTYTVKMRNALHQVGNASLPFSVTTPAVKTVSVRIPNGAFDMIYKPGQTTITATISGCTDGIGSAAGVSGTYNFSDNTSGTVADVPGWIGYDRDGWVNYGGAGTRDRANGNQQGVLQPGGRTSGNSYNVNGAEWNNRAGGLIVSAAPLGSVQGNATYVLVGYACGKATPFVLRLLADGVEIVPTAATDPKPGDDWQKFSRTYAPGDLAKHVGKAITIVCGLDRDAKGTQIAIDDLSLRCYVP